MSPHTILNPKLDTTYIYHIVRFTALQYIKWAFKKNNKLISLMVVQ